MSVLLTAALGLYDEWPTTLQVVEILQVELETCSTVQHISILADSLCFLIPIIHVNCCSDLCIDQAHLAAANLS